MAPIHLNKIQRIFKIWDVWVARDSMSTTCCQQRLAKVCVKVAPSAHVWRAELHKVGTFFSPPKTYNNKKKVPR